MQILKNVNSWLNETDVDCFAPALGSVHGPYKGEPNLGYKEMEEVRDLTNMPLSTSWRYRHPYKRYPKSDFSWNIKNQCEYRKSNCVHKSGS